MYTNNISASVVETSVLCGTMHVLSNAVTGWEELVLYDLFFELTGMLNFNSINKSLVCDCSL